MVGRPACRRGLCAFEAQRLKVELVDERIDDTHRVVFSDVVIEALGQQGDLASVLSLDESLHVAARSVALPSICQAALRDQAFSHSLGRKRSPFAFGQTA